MSDNTQRENRATDHEDKVRLVGREMLYKGFVRLEKLIFEQRMPDGSLVTVDREVHDHGNAAGILLHNAKNDTVVMVRQFRPGAFANGDQAFMLEIPAGLVDEGEIPAQAVLREAMEETGYAITSARHLFDIYPSPGALTERLSLFAASVEAADKVGDGGGLAGEAEDIELVTLGLDDAYRMIESGEITDAKTVLALQWAMINRAKLSAGNLG